MIVNPFITILLTCAIQFVEIFSKKEQKSREVSVKRAKISDSMLRTSKSTVGEADLCLSPSTSSKASDFQKIVPFDCGVSSCYGFNFTSPFILFNPRLLSGIFSKIF